MEAGMQLAALRSYLTARRPPLPTLPCPACLHPLPACCSLSPLAIQTRNLLEDPRCSVVVQMPGWTGLANARVTIFGEVHKLPGLELQEQAQEVGAPACPPRRERCCRQLWQACTALAAGQCREAGGKH